MFEEWYGGGPPISVIGPPVEDSRRWTIHLPLPPALEEYAGSEESEADLSTESENISVAGAFVEAAAAAAAEHEGKYSDDDDDGKVSGSLDNNKIGIIVAGDQSKVGFMKV